MLGQFAVVLDRREVAADGWRRRQAASLVKLLALAPYRRLHRERVIDALWPDLSVDEAAPRLHKAAFYARKALGIKDAVVLTDESVSLFPGDEVVVDVFEFDDAAGEAERDGGTAAAERALALYGGELLPDDVFEPWSDELRERLRALHSVLLRQAQRWEDLIHADAADEEAHLELMRTYAESGDRRAALRQFERMDRALRRELGVGPSTAAIELRDQLVAAGVDAPSVGASHGLAGRATEMAQLDALLDRAEGSIGRTVFLSGPPGVGKSALTEWAASRASERGWLVGTGVATAVEGAWPYAPALEAVADLVRDRPHLLDELAPQFRDAIDRVLSGRDEEWTGDSGHQQLFIATAELVRLAARDRGVLLVIDDVHEADEGSLRLLHYLSRSLGKDAVVLVLAHRDTAPIEPLDDARSSLLHRRAATSITLEPLDLEATGELVRATRSDVTNESIERIHQISGGMPLAIAELAAHPDAAIDDPAAIGGTVVAALARSTRDVLQRVAVVGSTFDTDEFVALSDLEDDDAYAQLDAALAARVVVRVEKGYRFRHDLVRQALLDGLPSHRRKLVHRQAARRLEELDGSPARVGHHLLQAGETEAAVPFVRRAAETEAAMGAFADALALIEPVIDQAGADRSVLLALRADFLAAVGDRKAVPAYREALDVASPDQLTLLRARMGRAAAMSGDLATAREAIDGLETDGGPHDGVVLNTRGMVSYLSGDLEGAEAAAHEARELVARGAKNWQLLDGISLQGLLAHNRGEWYERMRYELQATRDSLELATTVFDSHLCVVEYLLYGPTPYDEVMELASELRRSGERTGALRAVAFARAVAGEAALLAGDLDLAERELSEAVDAHRDISAQAGEALALQRLAEVRLASGDREAAVTLLRESLAKARWSMLAPHLLQRIFGTLIRAAADPDEARAVVDQADATLANEDHCHFCQVMYALPAAMACADVGDLDLARHHLQVGELSAAGWQGTSWQAALLEARSHVVRAEGDRDEADRLLASAGDLFEEAGQPLDAARCRTRVAA